MNVALSYMSSLLTTTQMPTPSKAWYRIGGFDLTANTWASAVAGGPTAAISGSGASSVTAAGNGATAAVTALSGTTSTNIDFGDILADTFTICSMSRYSGSNMGRIIRGTPENWLHGHHGGDAGVAHYGSWVTATTGNPSGVVDTDWVYMCGANGGTTDTGKKIANGIDGTVDTGGVKATDVLVNTGYQTSDFEIVEIMTWSRALTEA